MDLDALDELVARMARLQDQVARACRDAEARVRELRGTWSGVAASGYVAADEQWKTGAGEAQEALAVLRSVASTAHSNYVAAVTANRRMWQS